MSTTTSVSVKKISIQIGKKRISLTHNEAKELYWELDYLFSKESECEPPPVPGPRLPRTPDGLC